MMHKAWELYCAFWAHNGNVAILWHMGMTIMFFVCGVLVFCGDKLDRQRDARREYPENTDHHDY